MPNYLSNRTNLPNVLWDMKNSQCQDSPILCWHWKLFLAYLAVSSNSI